MMIPLETSPQRLPPSFVSTDIVQDENSDDLWQRWELTWAQEKNPLPESHVVMNLHQFISLHLHLPSQISSTDWAWASPYHFNNFFHCSAGKWWKFIKFMGRERNDYQKGEKSLVGSFSSFSVSGALCITNFVTFHARCFNTFLSLALQLLLGWGRAK